MKALIDGDILAYAMGGLKKRPPEKDQEEDICPELEEGELLPFEVCFGAVENKIDSIIKATNADSYEIFLSSPIHKSWRYETATILPYKGNREGAEKPPYWKSIRDNIERHHPCHIAENIEADDAMSIEQYAGLYKDTTGEIVQIKSPTVICSIDKDLMMVLGWHYNWNKDEMVWQDELDGLRCFYTQLLTGDSTDNILGLFGMGPSSAAVKRVKKEHKTEQEMFNEVWKRYLERFGNYAEQFLKETGLLLKMQETREDRWDRFEELMDGKEEKE